MNLTKTRARIAAMAVIVCQLMLAVELRRVTATPQAPLSPVITSTAPAESIVGESANGARLDRSRTASRTPSRQPVVLVSVPFDPPLAQRPRAIVAVTLRDDVLRAGPRLGRAPPALLFS